MAKKSVSSGTKTNDKNTEKSVRSILNEWSDGKPFAIKTADEIADTMNSVHQWHTHPDYDFVMGGLLSMWKKASV